MNGGESIYTGDWTPARAISCSLEVIADEMIELLSFIDQPNYSTTLYIIEAEA
jgi:hypothetical protein